MGSMANYIILGLVQGVTEFFPVSSHGHLKVAQKLMGMDSMDVAVDVILHLGTLSAVFLFFFPDIVKALRDRKMWLTIFIVTFITGVIAVGGKDFFMSIFDNRIWLIAGWVVSGCVLLLTGKFMSGKKEQVSVKDAAVMGVAQGLAVVPSISRSGFTIASLLFLGVERRQAFAFSFIASIPAILGAAVLDVKDIGFAFNSRPGFLIAGFAASFIAGLCALALLKKVIIKQVFHLFGYYCFAAAVITFFFVK